MPRNALDCWEPSPPSIYAAIGAFTACVGISLCFWQAGIGLTVIGIGAMFAIIPHICK